MKTEMKMLDNGNYESVACCIQHECYDKMYEFRCLQYASDMSKLILIAGIDDSGEDGCEHEIEVSFCPFCGHQPERLNPEASKEDAIV